MIRSKSKDQLSLPFAEPTSRKGAYDGHKKIRPRRLNIQVRFDRDTDALYVRFSDDPVAETAEVRPGVMFDYGADGRIVAMEILDASRTVAASDLKKLALEVA